MGVLYLHGKHNVENMKLYIWEGIGFFLGATVIVCADCISDAKELIEKELIDNGLAKSWEESQELEVIEINDTKVVYFDNSYC
jgi:hypothetical protein